MLMFFSSPFLLLNQLISINFYAKNKFINVSKIGLMILLLNILLLLVLKYEFIVRINLVVFAFKIFIIHLITFITLTSLRNEILISIQIMRLISLLFILISFYPTSLLGGSILNGSFSVFTFLFISLIIIIYSLNKLSLKNFKINGDFKPILFTLLFLIILLIVHKDTYLVRECVILIVSFLLFETPQKNTFKNLNFGLNFLRYPRFFS